VCIGKQNRKPEEREWTKKRQAEGTKNHTTLEEKQFTNYHHEVSNCLTFLYKR